MEVEKANIYKGSRYTYFITFVVTDRCLDDNQTKIFQAKVRNVICREIVHSFYRPKPDEGGIYLGITWINISPFVKFKFSINQEKISICLISFFSFFDFFLWFV